jgi:hypothetical protein
MAPPMLGNSPQHGRDLTAAAVMLALCAAAILDLATATSLSLTDKAPSFWVVLFGLADAYASPVALGTVFLAGILWMARSPKAFIFIFDVTLWLSMIALLVNVVGLIVCLFDKQDNPEFLLLSAGLVYLENIAVFAAYYWRFDHPHQKRIATGEQTHPGVVFPQNTLAFKTLHGWNPGFIDYLFLSFNTSSTFGPTLPIPLRGAIQFGMMLQVAFAMAVLVMIAARAIGMIS